MNEQLTALVLAAAEKPAGLFTPTELPGFAAPQVGMVAHTLAQRGELHCVPVKGPAAYGRLRRYFRTAEAAANYKAGIRTQPAQDESWKLFSACRPGEYPLPVSTWAHAATA